MNLLFQLKRFEFASNDLFVANTTILKDGEPAVIRITGLLDEFLVVGNDSVKLSDLKRYLRYNFENTSTGFKITLSDGTVFTHTDPDLAPLNTAIDTANTNISNLNTELTNTNIELGKTNAALTTVNGTLSSWNNILFKEPELDPGDPTKELDRGALPAIFGSRPDGTDQLGFPTLKSRIIALESDEANEVKIDNFGPDGKFIKSTPLTIVDNGIKITTITDNISDSGSTRPNRLTTNLTIKGDTDTLITSNGDPTDNIVTIKTKLSQNPHVKDLTLTTDSNVDIIVTKKEEYVNGTDHGQWVAKIKQGTNIKFTAGGTAEAPEITISSTMSEPPDDSGVYVRGVVNGIPDWIKLGFIDEDGDIRLISDMRENTI